LPTHHGKAGFARSELTGLCRSLLEACGRDACLIGEIRAEPADVVALRNAFGGTRIVDMLVGDPMPRIC